MAGKLYLPEYLAAMTPHLAYRSLLVYLMPKHSTFLYGRKVATRWRPILLFGGKGKWVSDIVYAGEDKSADKDFHVWGQSPEGMMRIVESLTRPGDLVVDPFCGGGAT